MQGDDDIPEFLRLTPEQRRAGWEANPPKPSSTKAWRTPEQEELEKIRLQKISDEKRLRRCVSKQKRFIREQSRDAILNDRKASAEGKIWNARTAKWIDPIEEAMERGEHKVTEETKDVPAKKKEKKEKEPTSIFGFRAGTNYDRLMQYLLQHLGELVPVETLAKEAYGSGTDLKKHCKRVAAMVKKVEKKVIEAKRLAYSIKKEKKENVISFGLFAK